MDIFLHNSLMSSKDTCLSEAAYLLKQMFKFTESPFLKELDVPRKTSSSSYSIPPLTFSL